MHTSLLSPSEFSSSTADVCRSQNKISDQKNRETKTCQAGKGECKKKMDERDSQYKQQYYNQEDKEEDKGEDKEDFEQE